MAVEIALIALLLTVGAAAALAGEPFEIEQFTLQTTIPRQVPESSGFRVVNEPYPFTQAGGRPYALTTKFVFKSEEVEQGGKVVAIVPTEDVRDVVVNLPPGLIGDPLAVPRCSLTSVTGKKANCPPDTQIGSVRFRFFDGFKEAVGPIYNVTPEAGQSAEFAFVVSGINALVTAHLTRTAKGYGITVVSKKVPIAEVVEVEPTFWGVPAEARYDWLRGLSCDRPTVISPQCTFGSGGGEEAGLAPVPFLALPTDCSAGPEQAVARADSWEHPGRVGVGGDYEDYVERATTTPAVTGCALLKFEPGIEVQPDTLIADEPVGLDVNVRVPQNEQPSTLATPHLRNATVTLPLGMSVSPGIVDGIRACEAAGPEGINFTGPESEQIGLDGELQLAPGHCPDASIVGEAEAETPLLEHPVKGHVYLARPGCGGAGQPACTEQDALDGNLYKLYLELGGAGALGDAGVNIKVEGRVQANPATGQLTTIFDENPQTPFTELRVRLNSGPRAPLDNPSACGEAKTTSDLSPWSAPGETPEEQFVAGTADATPSSFFPVGGCPRPPVLNPGFLAGTVIPQAARFSTFTLNLSRQDREQYVKGIQVHTPQGLLGMLSSVPLCGEPAANAGACPEGSKIGTTRVASGAGSHPFEIGGAVYLTGPYAGAPFGLSVVTRAVAGPFNLGLVVVRARIDIDPNTSTLTVTTDETGSHAIPQILFGVPLRLQRVIVDIDRPGFMFNPTNCAAQQITAAISGAQQAVARVSSSFAAVGCKKLAFKPSFKAWTDGHTSRKSGASLDVRLAYPKGAFGNDANVASVKVSLPKQLPSQLTTLQKACAAATFETNPSACPSASVVGIVRASTPVLPVGLSGPVYFVSHGGQAFPSLVVVLEGEGIRVDLTGSTFINKTGITSSTFKGLPDVPVNTFELYLPRGRFAALAANSNLCNVQAKLKMPTEFIAQNGAVLKQSTKIQVTGCKAGAIARSSGRFRRTNRRAPR